MLIKERVDVEGRSPRAALSKMVALIRAGFLRAHGELSRADLLALVVAVPLVGVSPARAQDSVKAVSEREGSAIETVVVTGSGIAASYAAGIKTKRDADVMVEAIRSEDIGKMPDKNLAEALQRVPGVAIDRDGGEGRYVTMRGFGPQYNAVLFNGRRLATTENTRAFAFDTIASELIGGMNVYKTQEAYMPEGGIGGTVDARTLRPLEREGFHFAGRLEGNRENNSGKTTPNLGLTVSDTFLNNTLGVLLGLSYQRRDTATFNANNGGGVTAGFVAESGVPGMENHKGYWMQDDFGFGGKGLYPQGFDRTSTFEERERKGLYGSLQYKPNSQLEFVADYLYSGFNVDTQLYQTGNWNYFEPPADATFAGLKAGLTQWGDNFTDDEINRYMGYLKTHSKTVIGPNGVLSSGSTQQGALVGTFANNEINHRPTKTQMLGLNGKWKPSRFTTVTGDFAYSKAETNNFGDKQNQRRSLMNALPGSYTYKVGPGGQGYISDMTPGLAMTPENYGSMYLQSNYNSGSRVGASQTQLSLMVDQRLTPGLKLRAGAHAEIGKKENQNFATPSAIQNVYWKSVQPLQLTLSKDQFSSIVSGVYAPSPSLFAQPENSDTRTFILNHSGINKHLLNPSVQNALLSACVANPSVCAQPAIGGLAKLQAGLAAFNAAAAANGGDPYAAQQIGTVPTNGGDPGYSVKEKITSMYADATWNFDLAGRDATLVGGVRVTRTRTTAGGWAQVLTKLTPDTSGLPPYNVLIPTYGDGPAGNQFVTASSSYIDVLPTLNFKYEAMDDVVLRAAASKSLTRPELGQLAPRFSYGALSVQNRTATSNSNPDLKPIKSTNFDLGAEWYFSKQASLHFDLFFKNVTGFPSTEKINMVIPTVQPEIYNTFTVSMPVNAASIRVHGGTLGWTQAFASGFGFDVNTTIVRSNKKYDPSNFDPRDIRLPGLSDTLNLVGFYERNGFSARVAFNKRKAYLSTPTYQVQWPTTDFIPYVPAYQMAYQQIDARVAYEIAPNVTIYLEGANLTNERPKKWAFAENLVIDNPNYGRRIMLGVQGSY